MADFPTTLDTITPAFLSGLLGAEVSAVRGGLVPAQGAVSTAARLELDYAPGSEGPATAFAKWSAPIEAVRKMAAENGMYRREVRFYLDLADSSEVAVPACYFAGYDRDTDEFLLILEDLSESRVGSFYASSLDDVRAVVEALPAFHARWWNNPELDRIRWLFPADHPAVTAGLQASLAAALPATASRFPEHFQGTLSEVASTLAEGFAGVVERYVTSPTTLVHSDLHLQQVFFPTALGGRFAIFDWQTVARGFAGQDLARVVAMCLDTDTRRTHERDLVTSYHAGLVAHGVSDYSLDDCWNDYRLGLTWSVLLNVIAGASINREAMDADAAEHGTTLADTFFGRLDRALDDLEVRELLS